jgi:hypothetical protein
MTTMSLCDNLRSRTTTSKLHLRWIKLVQGREQIAATRELTRLPNEKNMLVIICLCLFSKYNRNVVVGQSLVVVVVVNNS